MAPIDHSIEKKKQQRLSFLKFAINNSYRLKQEKHDKLRREKLMKRIEEIRKAKLIEKSNPGSDSSPKPGSGNESEAAKKLKPDRALIVRPFCPQKSLQQNLQRAFKDKGRVFKKKHQLMLMSQASNRAARLVMTTAIANQKKTAPASAAKEKALSSKPVTEKTAEACRDDGPLVTDTIGDVVDDFIQTNQTFKSAKHVKTDEDNVFSPHESSEYEIVYFSADYKDSNDKKNLEEIAELDEDVTSNADLAEPSAEDRTKLSEFSDPIESCPVTSREDEVEKNTDPSKSIDQSEVAGNKSPEVTCTEDQVEVSEKICNDVTRSNKRKHFEPLSKRIRLGKDDHHDQEDGKESKLAPKSYCIDGPEATEHAEPDDVSGHADQLEQETVLNGGDGDGDVGISFVDSQTAETNSIVTAIMNAMIDSLLLNYFIKEDHNERDEQIERSKAGLEMTENFGEDKKDVSTGDETNGGQTGDISTVENEKIYEVGSGEGPATVDSFELPNEATKDDLSAENSNGETNAIEIETIESVIDSSNEEPSGPTIDELFDKTTVFPNSNEPGGLVGEESTNVNGDDSNIDEEPSVDVSVHHNSGYTVDIVGQFGEGSTYIERNENLLNAEEVGKDVETHDEIETAPVNENITQETKCDETHEKTVDEQETVGMVETTTQDGKMMMDQFGRAPDEEIIFTSHRDEDINGTNGREVNIDNCSIFHDADVAEVLEAADKTAENSQVMNNQSETKSIKEISDLECKIKSYIVDLMSEDSEDLNEGNEKDEVSNEKDEVSNEKDEVSDKKDDSSNTNDVTNPNDEITTIKNQTNGRAIEVAIQRCNALLKQNEDGNHIHASDDSIITSCITADRGDAQDKVKSTDRRCIFDKNANKNKKLKSHSEITSFVPPVEVDDDLQLAGSNVVATRTKEQSSTATRKHCQPSQLCSGIAPESTPSRSSRSKHKIAETEEEKKTETCVRSTRKRETGKTLTTCQSRSTRHASKYDAIVSEENPDEGENNNLMKVTLEPLKHSTEVFRFTSRKDWSACRDKATKKNFDVKEKTKPESNDKPQISPVSTKEKIVDRADESSNSQLRKTPVAYACLKRKAIETAATVSSRRVMSRRATKTSEKGLDMIFRPTADQTAMRSLAADKSKRKQATPPMADPLAGLISSRLRSKRKAEEMLGRPHKRPANGRMLEVGEAFVCTPLRSSRSRSISQTSDDSILKKKSFPSMDPTPKRQTSRFGASSRAKSTPDKPATPQPIATEKKNIGSAQNREGDDDKTSKKFKKPQMSTDEDDDNQMALSSKRHHRTSKTDEDKVLLRQVSNRCNSKQTSLASKPVSSPPAKCKMSLPAKNVARSFNLRSAKTPRK